MSQRSKREVAPPMPQTSAPSFPWWAAMNPGVALPPSGEAMTPPPGWWPAPPHQHGAWMGPVPTQDGECNLSTLEGSIGGYVSLPRNDQTSFPAPYCNPVTQHTESGSKDKNVISIDDGDEGRKEKRLSWMPDEVVFSM